MTDDESAPPDYSQTLPIKADDLELIIIDVFTRELAGFVTPAIMRGSVDEIIRRALANKLIMKG